MKNTTFLLNANSNKSLFNYKNFFNRFNNSNIDRKNIMEKFEKQMDR